MVLCLNTPLFHKPSETVLGIQSDGSISLWHSIIRGRNPQSCPAIPQPLLAFLFSPDHVMAYSVNVVKLHCLEMHLAAYRRLFVYHA